MARNVYGCSWWAVAAAAMNLPWINLAGLVVMLADFGNSPSVHRYWVLAGLVWVISTVLMFICVYFAFKSFDAYPELRGRGLARSAVAVALSGPILRFVYFRIF